MRTSSVSEGAKVEHINLRKQQNDTHPNYTHDSCQWMRDKCIFPEFIFNLNLIMTEIEKKKFFKKKGGRKPIHPYINQFYNTI